MSLRQHNTYIIDVLKDIRERKFTVDEIEKKEEDETKKEKQADERKEQ